ncbi:MAG: hypothetical protein AAGD35_18055 [Actinomycetota bacterium]
MTDGPLSGQIGDPGNPFDGGARPGLDATWGQPRPQTVVGEPAEAPPRRPEVKVRPGRERRERRRAARPQPVTGPPYPRTSLAVPALVLSIAGLLCCGLGIFGGILGALDVRAIDRGLTDPSRRREARAALMLGLFETLFLMLILLIWIPLALGEMN